MPLDARIALRFSAALASQSMTQETIVLRSPDGPVVTRLIAAEDGRLVFLWPAEPLWEHTRYSVVVSGVVDQFGVQLEPASITFETRRRTDEPIGSDPEEWVPDASDRATGWKTRRPPSSWESLPPRIAPPGTTAIAGRVLTLDGRPLADVTLEVNGGGTARSDRTGRFLLTLSTGTAGRLQLQMDGASASRPGQTYGFFEYGMTVAAGQTNVLPFTIWMPKLDTRHVVRIPSPTTSEVVVTTLDIPGLELHLPPQTVVRDHHGQVVTEISLTPIPVDRPPFPLPAHVEVPVYFTAQPGGAYVYTSGSGPKGGWLVYPNYGGGVAGQLFQFFHYDPDVLDWHVYGTGKVTDSGAQVVPDAKTRLYEFTGAMITGSSSPPPLAPTPDGPTAADPVDPSTGVFVMHKTDLALPDVIPLSMTRTYDSGDNLARPFGRGMTHPYAMFLWSANEYQEADLILPEGGKIHFVRTSAGTSYTDAVFVHQETQTTSATPTAFYKSQMVWKTNGGVWELTLTDGTVYVFGERAPLQAIRDRYGNTVTITHASGQTGNVTRVTSPNGRWFDFTYDTSDRITQVKDNSGRVVTYTYTNGKLSTVTDPETNVTTYTWDASDRLATIRDGRNTVYLSTTYTNGRVTQQTLADSAATYQLSYTVDGSGNITQTDITDPRGHVERMAFNSDHYVTSVTEAYGTSLARTTTTTRQSGSNLVTAIVDGLSRRTEYTYDSTGHVLTAVRLAGTADALTTTLTYESLFHQLATVTDPVSHTWTLGYNAAGKLASVTDPLSHQTTVALNAAGQVTSVTDPLTHAWQFGYAGGDLTATTDPLGAVRKRGQGRHKTPPHPPSARHERQLATPP